MIGWITLAVVVLLAVGAAGYGIWRWKRPAKLKTDYFRAEWSELQKLLRNKDRWDVALVTADNLLNTALKKKRIRGHNMGERLVKAQRLFTDNDGVWFGHKLRARIESEPELKLKEKDVKQALMGIRQALKDIGALPR